MKHILADSAVVYNTNDLFKKLGITLPLGPATPNPAKPRNLALRVRPDAASGIIIEGQRNITLTSFAGSMRRCGIGKDAIEAALLTVNQTQVSPPLPEDEVHQIVGSIMKYPASSNVIGAAEQLDQTEITTLFSPEAYRAARFGEELPPRRWLFNNILPFGKVAVIVAPGGTGKSQLLLQIGVSIATGIPLAGLWMMGEVGGVLMLLAEDDEEEIHRRYNYIIRHLAGSGYGELIGKVRENLFVKSMVSENNQMTAANQSRDVEHTIYVERLIATARLIPNLKLIVIDPASRFRGGDENAAQDTTRFIEAIERVAQATGATILFAHHTNKGSMQSSEQSQSASRGSSALTDGVRWQMNLAGMAEREATEYGIVANERHHYLSATITKNNYAAPQPKVMLKRGDGGYLHAISLTSVKDAKVQDVKAKIVQLVTDDIKAGRRYSKTRFASEYCGSEGPLRIGNNAVRDALNELLAANRLSLRDGKLAGPLKAKLIPAAAKKPDTTIS